MQQLKIVYSIYSLNFAMLLLTLSKEIAQIYSF
jgi:hypothetical protein